MQATEQFEFNDLFLETLMDQLNTMYFSTFAYNCERLRLRPTSDGTHGTASIWSYMLSRSDEFVHRGYCAPDAALPAHRCEPLAVSVEQRHLRFWSEHYLKWSNRVTKFLMKQCILDATKVPTL